MFKTENIMTVFGMYVFETVVSVKNRFHEIELVGKKHDYLTRNRGKLALSPHKLRLFEKKTQIRRNKIL